VVAPTFVGAVSFDKKAEPDPKNDSSVICSGQTLLIFSVYHPRNRLTSPHTNPSKRSHSARIAGKAFATPPFLCYTFKNWVLLLLRQLNNRKSISFLSVAGVIIAMFLRLPRRGEQNGFK
jgi:hypothetical protein